jgi:hydrogenase maturation protease
VSRGALVVGVGNVFLGDDGFGVEVVRQLLRGGEVPAGVTVADYGIRGLHLALDLLDTPELLVVADAVARGLAPGTVTLLRPELDTLEPGGEAEGHGMELSVVFRTVRALGGTLPPTWIVGCEPAVVDEQLGLSEAVARAIAPAVALVRELLARTPQEVSDVVVR